MIFGKESKKKYGPGKDEIFENIQKLGFEVGYFHHSEVGWVGRKYKEIEDLVKANAEHIDVEGYYEAAKKEGREKRRQDIAKGLSKKSTNINSESHEKVDITFNQTDTESTDTKSSAKSIGPIEFHSPIEKPEMESKPGALKKPKVLKAPKFLR